MKKKKEEIIILVMILLFLFMGIFLLMGFKKGKECLGNPFIFGANKITNEDTGNLYCTCSFGNPRYNRFYFDNEYLEIMEG